jgi:flagellar capping protein FliD
MRLNAKVGIAAAIGAIAMTGPAVAQACNNGQGNQKNQVRDQQKAQFGHDQSGSNHGEFTGFGRRGRSFGRSTFGVLVSWTATQTGTNTYTGSITVSKPSFKGDRDHWKSGSNTGSGSTTQPTSQTTQVTYTFTNAKVFFGQGANPPAAGDLVKVIGARLGHCHSTGTGTSTSAGNVRAIFIAAPRSSSQSSSSQSQS